MIEPDTSGGKILCFTVPSRSEPGVLRHVDPCDDSCDCPDYLWRKSDTVGLSKEERRCYHIKMVRDHLRFNVCPYFDNDILDDAIAGYAKKMGRKFE